MNLRFLRAFVIFVLIAQPAMTFGAQSLISPPSQIPFNAAATPLEQHGARELLIVSLFILIAACAIYVIRRKKPLLELSHSRNKRLKIIERARLNPKSTLYIVEFDQRSVLIGQCADNLICLVDTGLTNPESDKPNA